MEEWVWLVFAYCPQAAFTLENNDGSRCAWKCKDLPSPPNPKEAVGWLRKGSWWPFDWKILGGNLYTSPEIPVESSHAPHRSHFGQSGAFTLVPMSAGTSNVRVGLWSRLRCKDNTSKDAWSPRFKTLFRVFILKFSSFYYLHPWLNVILLFNLMGFLTFFFPFWKRFYLTINTTLKWQN